jgi:DNA-3-methyladenine glycosylase II
MWFNNRSENNQWKEAARHLAQASPVMKQIIHQVGPCTLKRDRFAYVSLVQSILSQQVSVAAATSMYNKLRSSVPKGRVTPESVGVFLATANDEQIKGCGLSSQKRRYVKELSERFLDGRVPVKKFSKMTDEQVIESLTDCVGIGVWTAQIFLMFTLNRPDVWPVGDLGLRQSVFNHFKIKDREDWDAVENVGEAFKPWRTIACWYLWRGKNLEIVV